MTIGGYNSSLHRLSRTSGSPALRLLGLSQSLRFDSESRRKLLSGSELSGKLEHEPISQLRRLLEERSMGEGEETTAIHSDDVIYGAAGDIAWTPIISSTAYQIGVEDLMALDEAGGEDNVGRKIASSSDLGSCVVDSGMLNPQP